MKKLFYSLISLAMLCSCSNKENSLIEEEFSYDIKVNATVSKMAVSKSIITGNSVNDVNFLRVDQASENPVPSDFSASTTPITGNLVNGTVDFTGQAPKYAHSNAYTYMVGYWPAGVLADKVITWDIDGKTDILLSNTWCAGNYTNPVKNGMVFDHQLSRLQVICKAQEGVALEAVADTWGEITAIEFVGVKPQLQMNTSDKKVTSTGTVHNAALLQNDYSKTFATISIPAAGNTTVNAATMQAAMQLPEGESYSLQLLVKTTKMPAGKTINVALKDKATQKLMAFEAGKTHTVTLTFKSTDKVIEVTSTTIKDWAEGYFGENDVEI